jgi:hypothetical protein
MILPYHHYAVPSLCHPINAPSHRDGIISEFRLFDLVKVIHRIEDDEESIRSREDADGGSVMHALLNLSWVIIIIGREGWKKFHYILSLI